MSLQQIKYAVSILTLMQAIVVLVALVLIIRNVVLGLRRKDKSKYKAAVTVLIYAVVLVIAIAIVEFLVLLK